MSSSALHLTFDDGPDPVGTPLVLDALARHGARATFFVLGAAVRRSPDLVAAIHAAGHRIELHGDAHLDHRGLEATVLRDDTTRAIDALRATGVTPTWWRLPWGRPGPATRPLADRLGLRIVGWDVDTHDWRCDAWDDQPPARTARATPGALVLLHDGFGPGARRDRVDNTLALIDGYARLAEDAGFDLAPLPDAAADEARTIPADPAPDPAAPATSVPTAAEGTPA